MKQNRKKYIYVLVYNEDAWEGMRVPSGMRKIIEDLMELEEDLFSEIYDTYTEYSCDEIEHACEAREEPYELVTIKDLEGLKEWFNEIYNLNEKPAPPPLPEDISVKPVKKTMKTEVYCFPEIEHEKPGKKVVYGFNVRFERATVLYLRKLFNDNKFYEGAEVTRYLWTMGKDADHVQILGPYTFGEAEKARVVNTERDVRI